MEEKQRPYLIAMVAIVAIVGLTVLYMYMTRAPAGETIPVDEELATGEAFTRPLRTCPDNDLDGYTTCAGDCNDGNRDINPGKEDFCNGVDDNCDGKLDESDYRAGIYMGEPTPGTGYQPLTAGLVTLPGVTGPLSYPDTCAADGKLKETVCTWSMPSYKTCEPAAMSDGKVCIVTVDCAADPDGGGEGSVCETAPYGTLGYLSRCTAIR